jgi:hypothetical protein
MSYFPFLASVIAAFVASSVWYSPLLFGKQFMELSGVGPSAGPNVGKVVGELGRNLILAYVLGRFVVLLEVVDWKGALNLGVWLWIGFPVLLLSVRSCGKTYHGCSPLSTLVIGSRRYSSLP